MPVVRWCLLVLLIVAGMVGASLGVDADGWSATVSWTRAQRPRLARYQPCPRLHAGPAPVPATGGYGAVVRAAGAARASDVEHLLRSVLEGAADRDGVPAALVQLAPACDLLRAAARADDAVGSGDPDIDAVQLLAVADALLLTATRAELDVAAAQDLLDVFACGIDLAHSSVPLEHMLGPLVLRRAAAAVDDALLARCSPAARQVLADGLAVADGVLLPESMLPLLLVTGLVDRLDLPGEIPASALGLANRLQAWRQGFSVRDSGRARTRAVVTALQRFTHDAVHADGWPARRALLAELARADRAANPDLWRPFLFGVEEDEECRRLAVANLRLLRLALAWHAGAPLPTLADPLGDGALRVDERDGAVRLRSAQEGVQWQCRR